VALGLFIRVGAFFASGEMAVAYFWVSAGRGFFPIANGGEAAVFYCFAFFYIFFRGPGRWSLGSLGSHPNITLPLVHPDCSLNIDYAPR
jgi:putative oxidoreductase